MVGVRNIAGWRKIDRNSIWILDEISLREGVVVTLVFDYHIVEYNACSDDVLHVVLVPQLAWLVNNLEACLKYTKSPFNVLAEGLLHLTEVCALSTLRIRDCFDECGLAGIDTVG